MDTSLSSWPTSPHLPSGSGYCAPNEGPGPGQGEVLRCWFNNTGRALTAVTLDDEFVTQNL